MLTQSALELRAAPPPQAPNILVILSDDAGYADFGSQPGSPDFDLITPRIDSIAAAGVRFSSGYVSGAVCAPTRAGFMTGKYQHRFGFSNNPNPQLGDTGLAVDQVTIADNMKALGYRTYCIGKWHLGSAPQYHPNVRGFDEFLGFLEGARSYFSLGTPGPLLRIERNGASEFPGGEPGTLYTTDLWGDEAAAYIDDHVLNHAGTPFFMYLSFNSVHTPMDADPVRLADPRVQAVINDPAHPQRQELAAMTLAMDENVGKVLDRLTLHGIENNTLVVFFNDNGGAEGSNSSDNGVLRGSKGFLWEGGIRVPFFVKWPACIPVGQVIDEPVIQLDLLPTCVAAAGGSLPPGQETDGVNLLPRVTGQVVGPPHPILFWRTRGSTVGQSAVRKGIWKLFRQDAVGGGLTSLYNLATDIGETTDLSAANPDKVEELLADLTAWECSIIEPLWGNPQNPTGEVLLSGGASVLNSDLGYQLENPGPGFGYGLNEERFPLPLTHDWSVRFTMDLVDDPALEERGFVVLSGGTDTADAIRLGVTASPPRMSIVEGMTGTGSQVALSAAPSDPTDYVIAYDSAADALTLSFDGESVTRSLAGTYTQFNYTGYATRESKSQFSLMKSDTDLRVTPVTQLFGNGVNLAFEFIVENGPAATLTLEASNDLINNWSPVAGAVLTDLGGGRFRFQFPQGPDSREYYRVEAAR